MISRIALYLALAFAIATIVQALAVPAPGEAGLDTRAKKKSKAKPKPKPKTKTKQMYGRATYYDVGLGCCGETDSNKEPIIAVSLNRFHKTMCGKWISFSERSTGKTQRGQVKDCCGGCAPGDLDLSPSLFKRFYRNHVEKGTFPIAWKLQSSSKKRDLIGRDDTQEFNGTFIGEAAAAVADPDGFVPGVSEYLTVDDWEEPNEGEDGEDGDEEGDGDDEEDESSTATTETPNPTAV